MLYLTMHSTVYLWLYGIGNMVKDHLAKEETCCHYMYSFQLAAKVLLYATSQHTIYQGLCYTSRGALARKRNSSMDPP